MDIYKTHYNYYNSRNMCRANYKITIIISASAAKRAKKSFTIVLNILRDVILTEKQYYN